MNKHFYRNSKINKVAENFNTIYKLFYVNFCNNSKKIDKELFGYGEILSSFSKDKKFYELIKKLPQGDSSLCTQYIIGYKKKIDVNKYSISFILTLLASNIKVKDFFVFKNSQSEKDFLKKLILASPSLYFKAYKDVKTLKKIKLSFKEKFRILSHVHQLTEKIDKIFTQDDYLKIIEKYPVYVMKNFPLIKKVKGYKQILKKLYSKKRIDIKNITKKDIEKYPNLIYLIDLNTFDLSQIPFSNFYIQVKIDYNNLKLIEYLNEISMTHLVIGKKNWKKNFKYLNKNLLINYNYILFHKKALYDKLELKEQDRLLNYAPWLVKCKFITQEQIFNYMKNNPKESLFSYQPNYSFLKKCLKNQTIDRFINQKDFYNTILFNKNIKISNQQILDNFHRHPIASFLQSKENTLTEKEYSLIEKYFLDANGVLKDFNVFEKYSLLYARMEMETNFPFEKLLNIINHHKDNIDFVNVLKTLPYYKNEAQLIKHFIDN